MKGHHSRYIGLFPKGTSSVNSFYEQMRRFCEVFTPLSEVIAG